MKMFFTQLFILLSPLFMSCGKADTGAITPPPELKAQQKLLALGDSYTIGQNVLATCRFPFHTVSALKDAGFDFSLPDYVAVTGWTTSNLLSGIKEYGPTNDYDAVTLLIGVNDQYQGKDTNSYRQNFTTLLNKAIQFAGGRKSRVFVLSIPDYSATPFVGPNDKDRISRELDLFNSINRRISKNLGVNYVYITDLTKMASSDLSLLANDRLHYSSKEYQQWAEMLVEEMKKSLTP